MNVLLHLTLGGTCPEPTLGQYLGDFARGAVASLPYPPGVLDGIRAHRAVDAACERHPFVRAVRRSFPDRQRRFAALAFDVFCDALLHRAWDQVIPVPKADFLAFANDLLARPGLEIPAGARRFASFLVRHDMLAAYADPGEIREVLTRMGRRLRRPVDLGAFVPAFLEKQSALLEDFPAFYRDLADVCAAVSCGRTVPPGTQDPSISTLDRIGGAPLRPEYISV